VDGTLAGHLKVPQEAIQVVTAGCFPG
jgi:hypothetical protein